jgi:hypothetical protein
MAETSACGSGQGRGIYCAGQSVSGSGGCRKNRRGGDAPKGTSGYRSSRPGSRHERTHCPRHSLHCPIQGKGRYRSNTARLSLIPKMARQPLTQRSKGESGFYIWEIAIINHCGAMAGPWSHSIQPCPRYLDPIFPYGPCIPR